jgi:hypothetical protein
MNAQNLYLDGCPFLPGTPEKVRVLQARATAHLPLFVDGDLVDCSADHDNRFGGRHLRLKPQRSPSPDTAAKVAHVAEGLRLGKTYRQMAKELGCFFTYVGHLAKLARQAV